MTETAAVNVVKRPSRSGHRLVRYSGSGWKKQAVPGGLDSLFSDAGRYIRPLFTQDPKKADFEIANMPPLGASIQQSVYDIKTGTFETKTIYGRSDHPLGTDIRAGTCWPC
jgi:hypothetical protein